MPVKPPPHRANAGFALVVMGALFVAFAVVAAVVIEKQTALMQITRQTTTQEQISRMANALIQYYVINGAYPCPAPINVPTNDLTFGVAAGSCTGGAQYQRGMVPILTLAPYGANLADAFDAWGSRIAYVVDRNLVAGGSGAAAGTATLTDWNLAQSLASPDFVIISFGRDRMGATPRDGTTVPIGCAGDGTLRTLNCNGGINFVTGPTKTGQDSTAGNYFDDIVSSYTK